MKLRVLVEDPAYSKYSLMLLKLSSANCVPGIISEGIKNKY